MLLSIATTDLIAQHVVLDSLPTAVNIADGNGVFVYVNRGACQKTGYSEDELIGQHWSFLYTKEDYEQLSDKFDLLMANGQWQGKVKILRKDGSTFTANIYLTILPSGMFSAAFNDIEHQLKLQAKLDELSAAVASTMDGVALLDADGNYYYLNEKHITHFGYEAEEELLGKSWRVIYPEYEVKRIEEDLFPHLARDGRWQGETLGKCKDGTLIHQDITLTSLTNGGLICIMRNITEKKLREKEIRKLALVANNTNNAVVITNARHEVEWMNEKAEVIFERKQEGVIGSPLFYFFAKMGIHTECLEGLQLNIQQVGSSKADICLQKKDGEQVWLNMSVNPVQEKTGIVNYIYLFWDITAAKEAEKNLMSALAKEKSLNELKSHFVNLTSHEFRTPLTSMQSSLDILKLLFGRDVAPSKDKLAKHLNQMEFEVDRMKELMDNVLVLGKINSGKIDYKPNLNNFISLVKEVLLSNRIKQFDQRIAIEIKGEEAEFIFDKRLLEHILSNLLINSLKYSQKSKKPPEISIAFRKEKVLFEIRDYGIGIPAEDQRNIFESFFRAANTQDIAGTGLGLSIVKQFIETHGGQIEFESQEGKGTIFKFELPIKQL